MLFILYFTSLWSRLRLQFVLEVELLREIVIHYYNHSEIFFQWPFSLSFDSCIMLPALQSSTDFMTSLLRRNFWPWRIFRILYSVCTALVLKTFFVCWNDILTLLDSRGSGVSVSTVITLSSASFSILGHLMGAASFILVVFIEITCEQAYLVWAKI